MKITVSEKFWNESKWLAKICFIVGAFFMDKAMKLNGYEEKSK